MQLQGFSSCGVHTYGRSNCIPFCINQVSSLQIHIYLFCVSRVACFVYDQELLIWDLYVLVHV